jgi:FkbM family methyltransferase
MNLRAAIAARRGNPVLKVVNSMCMKFTGAYDHVHNWDIANNGELFIVRAVTNASPGIVFDVGANIGHYIELCAPLPGVTAIHAFEISPPTFAILSRNCSAIANLRLNPVGLGAEAGKVTIHHAPDSIDRTGISAIDDGFARIEIAAEVVTGDSYMRAAGIDRIAFLKIDVEGHDLAALQGFEVAFAAGRVDAVQFEHGGPNVASRTFLRDSVLYLQQFDFVIFRLFPSSLEPIARPTYEMEDFKGRNYIALRPAMARQLGY